jgi:hypothetical protein
MADEQSREPWPSDYDDAVEGQCERCNRPAMVRVVPDPFTAEVHPDEPNPPRPFCYPCWCERKDDI